MHDRECQQVLRVYFGVRTAQSSVGETRTSAQSPVGNHIAVFDMSSSQLMFSNNGIRH